MHKRCDCGSWLRPVGGECPECGKARPDIKVRIHADARRLERRFKLALRLQGEIRA